MLEVRYFKVPVLKSDKVSSVSRRPSPRSAWTVSGIKPLAAKLLLFQRGVC